jgi:hypothetical protein
MDAHLSPFVHDVPDRPRTTVGNVDMYFPDASEPTAAILFVPGGPTPEPVRPRPHDWPVYQGYGKFAAANGVLGAVADHRLYHPGAYADAAQDVDTALAVVASHLRVDRTRIALWFFSGAGLLAADHLDSDFVVALTYPFLAPYPGWPVDPRFLPAERVGRAPVILTRVGKEHPVVAEGVEAFVKAAAPTIVDVPNGQHAFDVLDHTDESRAAVQTAMDLVIAKLNERRPAA